MLTNLKWTLAILLFFFSHSPGNLPQTFFTSFFPFTPTLGGKEKPSFGIAHLPLSNMLTYLRLFLSCFCFFSSKNNLCFHALEPILCHLLRTLTLTILLIPKMSHPNAHTVSLIFSLVLGGIEVHEACLMIIVWCIPVIL